MNFKLIGLGVAGVATLCGLVYVSARAGAKAGVAAQADILRDAARQGAEEGAAVNITITGCDEQDVTSNVVNKEQNHG